ncbi:short chain dehydrogenase [Nocardioides currus]|uniref:Short chain dehydrogenase n=2 Tax=Nocardioides currus TaxID=2133958 RepID=A0A2R7Z3B6_9ACTN|nr:short chain dehydrogenase [Nocardioides currus]
MSDKSILVTGGGSGIGRAASLVFAREGGRVLVADLYLERASETAELIREAGGVALAVRTDVSREDDVRAMVDLAVAELGQLDCAFNNAGIGTAATESTNTRIVDMRQEAWDRTLAVNLTSVWHCMRAEIPHMVERGGAIVNTASIAARGALAGSAAYVASKHGVAGLTKSAAIEYAEDGVRVNAVAPGHIETPLLEQALARRGGELSPRNPVRRFGRAEEIAETVVWLCSDRSSFTTGELVTIDGGRLARA